MEYFDKILQIDGLRQVRHDLKFVWYNLFYFILIKNSSHCTAAVILQISQRERPLKSTLAERLQFLYT